MRAYYDRVTKAWRVKPVSFLLASDGGERDVRTMNKQDSGATNIQTALLLDYIRRGLRLPASEDVMVDGKQAGRREQELVAQFRL